MALAASGEGGGALADVAGELLAALAAAPGRVDSAVSSVFEVFLTEISQNYFGQRWADEHEYSVWARLTDDPRAWGYGSDDEISPLRWLVEVTSRWFDGRTLLSLEEWLPRFEAWADDRASLVRRTTPGALDPAAFPGPPSDRLALDE